MFWLKLSLLSLSLFCSSCIGKYVKPPKIVIVGAGISGIAAAVKLMENGFNNIEILEAEDRIGGRIHSIPYDNGFIDLGAQWVHGETNNAVYDLVNEFFEFGDTGVDHADLFFVRFDAQSVDQEKSLRLYEEGLEILSAFSEMAVSEESLGEFFIRKFKEALSRSRYADIDNDLSDRFLHLFENEVNSWNGTESWFDASARLNAIFGVNDGNEFLTWRDRGYKTVFDYLTVS